jgi:hypothetical protein
MANPTTNYSFAMPTNTDLVKDLPADFEVFGQAVDTQMKTNADAAIAKSLVTTKGDLIAATGASTPARLAVGTNDYVLTADSTAAAGVAWKASASGSLTLLSTTTPSGTATTISSISQSYKQLQIQLVGIYSSSDGASLRVQVNSDTTGKYGYCGYRSIGAGATWNYDNDNYFNFANIMTNSTDPDNQLSGFINFLNYTSTGIKIGNSTTFGYTTANGAGAYALGLNYSGTSAISSITFTLTTGTFSGGSILIYGVN